MNKAFEKILERLKEKKKFYDFFYKKGRSKTDDIVKKATDTFYDEFKQIVHEVAKEYNGGWVPCSERLPEESGTYIVNAIENSIIHVTFAKWMPRMKKWNLTGCRSYWKVNAWQPLPEPFKERD